MKIEDIMLENEKEKKKWSRFVKTLIDAHLKKILLHRSNNNKVDRKTGHGTYGFI